MSSIAEKQDSINYPERLLPFVEYADGGNISLPERTNICEDLIDLYDLTELEARALVRYLENLNLTLENLKNKRVIDIGSGSGDFKKALKKVGNGFEIINFDDFFYNEDPDAVRGGAHRIDFPDGSFDLVIAYGSVPLSTSLRGQHDLIPPAIREMIRIVKPGGAVKIFPAAIDNPAFPEGKKRHSEMAAIVFDELDKIHSSNPSLKIKITRIKDSNNPPATRQLLEIFKP